MNEYEVQKKSAHGNSIIYEDQGEIDMACVDVDLQPCEAVDHMLTPFCKYAGVYRVFGRYRTAHKGARFSKFDRHLCAAHLATWAKLHATTVEALLKRSVEQ